MTPAQRAELLTTQAQLAGAVATIQRILDAADAPVVIPQRTAPRREDRDMHIREFCQFSGISRVRIYELINDGLPVDSSGADDVRRINVREALNFMAKRDADTRVEATSPKRESDAENVNRRGRRRPFSRSSLRGHIYFVQPIGICRVKIGFSEDPKRRIKDLEHAGSHRLDVLHTMPGTVAGERRLHSRFKKARLHGEWFELTAELLKYIEDLRTKEAARPTREVIRIEELQAGSEKGVGDV